MSDPTDDRPIRNQTPRVPSLDGLRAVSVGLVMLSHTTGSKGFIGMSALPYLAPLAGLGVAVFFVISGFLITGILVREIDRHGKINLRRFYWRRTVRIFPPFYAYLLILLALRVAGLIETPFGNFLFAASYTHNYAWIPWDWLLGHSWSLAVEEQFYLLWPGALVILASRRSVWLLYALLIVCPLLRAGTYHWEILSPGIALHLGSHAAADSLAVGCLLAFKRESLLASQPYQRFLRSRFFVLIPLSVIGIALVQDHFPLFCALIGVGATNVGIVLTIDHCVTYYDGYAGRILNSGPFVFVGAISYSLYLWQEPFLRHDAPLFFNFFPLNVILAVTCALLSYFTIEKYSLELRRRLDP